MSPDCPSIKAESAYDQAVLYAAEGKKAEAVSWLTNAAADGMAISDDLRADPALKPLHGDPAFEALLAGANAAGTPKEKPGS